MAKKEEDLELDVDAAAEGGNAGGSKKKLIIILALVVVLLAGGGGAAWFFLTGNGGDGEATDEAGSAKAEKDDKAKKGLPIYLSIEPNLVVNFEHPGKARYLQVGMDFLAYDQAVMDGVKLHMPAIRNELLIYFSGKSYEELSSREGKEAAKAETLSAVNRIIASRGIKGKVEDVYFTSFVMQ